MRFVGQVALGLGTALIALAVAEYMRARDARPFQYQPVAPGADNV